MIQNANSLYKQPQTFANKNLDVKNQLFDSSNDSKSGESAFAKHLGQYAQGVKETLQSAEKGVQAFALGQTDSEKVTPLVAAASVEVEALSKTVEATKNALNTILNMSV
ncbi:MAG: hypothetical protein C0432_00630 [Candidatus Puniceispirillum sp.]|nr:hypothetical protein [Candidatus Pelagibacter sp.]MBA4282788.1 hypothetical protein [Candidatus Puniceispirillum sp.]